MKKLKKRDERGSADYALHAFESALNVFAGALFRFGYKSDPENAKQEFFKFLREEIPIPVFMLRKHVDEILDKQDYAKNFVTYAEAFLEIIICGGASLEAKQNGNQELAWANAAESQYWAGALDISVRQRFKESEKNPAVEMARRRHAETYEMQRYVIEYWRENIDPSLSAQKAANELINVVKLSHKKIAEIVSKEKNKIQS